MCLYAVQGLNVVQTLNPTFNGVRFKVHPLGRTGPKVWFGVRQKGSRTGLNRTSATLAQGDPKHGYCGVLHISNP